MVHLLLAIIYFSFISLGLPDALLGAAWPNMYVDLQTSVSYAGIIFMIISAGTVVSSLMSDWLTYVLGTGKLTAISVGITIGRAINGFLTLKLNDTQLIRMGQAIVAVGILAMLLPLGNMVSLIGFILIGLGCAPIYPCIIHSTPDNFGANRSQAVIGVQMASAYMGNIVMPPLFGLIADYISIRLLPLYLAVILMCMYFMHKKMLIRCKT